MFSPVNLFGVNSTSSVISETDKDAPFNVKWLAEHFNFDDSDVKKSEFDCIGVMFEVHFKSDKESVAQKFYESLVEKGCHPQYFKFNNCVWLNKHQKEKIISAARSTSDSVSNHLQMSHEMINPVDFIAVRNQILSMPKMEPISNAKFNSNIIIPSSVIEKSTLDLTLEKIIPKPFNLDWLSEYLGLNKQYVTKSKFDFDFLDYSITFDTLENAQNFYQVLKQAGASLQIWEFSNTLEMAYSNQFEILRFVGQSDTGLNPWNIDFFATYFGLNKDEVYADKHSAYYYTLKFHNPHDAYNYYKKLIKNSIYPKKPGVDGNLVLTNNSGILLKEAAKYVKNHGLS